MKRVLLVLLGILAMAGLAYAEWQQGTASQEMPAPGSVASHASFLPGSRARVINAATGVEIEVIIAGRIAPEGAGGRVIDLSSAAARELGLPYGGPVYVVQVTPGQPNPHPYPPPAIVALRAAPAYAEPGEPVHVGYEPAPAEPPVVDAGLAESLYRLTRMMEGLGESMAGLNEGMSGLETAFDERMTDFEERVAALEAREPVVVGGTASDEQVAALEARLDEIERQLRGRGDFFEGDDMSEEIFRLSDVEEYLTRRRAEILQRIDG